MTSVEQAAKENLQWLAQETRLHEMTVDFAEVPVPECRIHDRVPTLRMKPGTNPELQRFQEAKMISLMAMMEKDSFLSWISWATHPVAEWPRTIFLTIAAAHLYTDVQAFRGRPSRLVKPLMSATFGLFGAAVINQHVDRLGDEMAHRLVERYDHQKTQA